MRKPPSLLPPIDDPWGQEEDLEGVIFTPVPFVMVTNVSAPIQI
jgi:hypothetical protein